MKVIKTVRQLQKLTKVMHLPPVGFVPTMGALHEGHLSLVRSALSGCSLVIVSIYVNPTQFNDTEDLKNYPRTLEADLTLLGDVLRQNDIVFTPADKEIYPTNDKIIFHFGNLDNVMEALYRPGHFNGVAQVVSRLFDIVRPDVAFFGIKDFQQVAVIKELVRQKEYNIKIIAGPIIREPDGLAMSSRNRLLEPEIRKNARVIFNTIFSASTLSATSDFHEIKKFVKASIENIPGFMVEYFEIVDDRNLMPVQKRSDMKQGKSYYGCIAVRAGKIRLIDNIEFPLV